MAGLFERVTNGLRMRIKPLDNGGISNIVPPSQDITKKQIESDDVASAPLVDVSSIHNFCSISTNRHNKYVGFEEMLEDPIIAAALEMYADDACQYNDSGKIIWAEGDDIDAVAAANRLIDVLDINKNCWRDIYSLCTYGDLYLRLYREGDESDYTTMYDSTHRGMSFLVKPEDTGRQFEEYVEYVDNPASIFDLQTKGKTAGFIRVCDTSEIRDDSTIFKTQPLQSVSVGNIISYDRTSFIHVSLSESVNRTPELLRIENNEEDSTIYKIKSGKSILADAYPVTQTLKLLEDSLTLNRMTRSAILRLIQIEVGDMPKSDVTNLLHRIKNNFEQKMAMNMQSGLTKSYNSPGPMDNMVYTVTKGGLGAVTVNNIGGDVNVKDIADLDYFNNKKLAALKIPKQFLNFDSPEGIGGNGTSLTKISSRYAHTIIRIQNAYTQGITDLINYFFLDKDLDFINKFTIRMVAPGTVEDTERSEKLNNDISQTRDLLDLFSELSDETRLRALQLLMSNKLRLNELASLISEELEKMEKEESTEDSDDDFDDFQSNDDFDDFDTDLGSPSGPPDTESELGQETPPPEPMEPES